MGIVGAFRKGYAISSAASRAEKLVYRRKTRKAEEMKESLSREIINHSRGKTVFGLSHGDLRYEALRKLTPWTFSELHKRNPAGESFDSLVDKLIEKDAK